jgi:tetratricopeptide (TPR) repeat protein
MHYLSLFLSIGLLFPFSMLLSQEGESDRNVLALDSVKEYLEAKQFPQAEKLLANTAFPVYGENPQTDSLALAAEYAYATLWYQTGRFSQALPAFEALLEKQIQFYGPENTQVAQTYNDIGITLGYSGNYERAKENYLKALEIARNIHDEDHPQVITALNNIGVFYERQGDYEKALEHYQYSLQLRLQRYGSSHEKIADSYNNIGNIYFYTNRIPEAKDYYQRTLDMYLKELGSRHISVGYAYMNLAISYALSGDLAEAEKLFLRDLSIRRSVYGESHPFVAYCYDNLGQLYQMQQDYEAAQKSYLRSLAISQEAYGETHPFIAQSYANLGMLNTLRERPGEAENFYYQALAVLGAYGNGAFGSPSQVRDLPKCLRILFDLLKLQRKDPTALEQSWESVQFASTLIDYMRQSYRAEGSRLYLQQYALPIFELGIETALALHEQNREPSLLESAFAISERASGVLLQQAFAGEKALSLPEIPASLREEEQNLRSLLNFYDQQLSSLQDSALENSYLVARFNTQARYDSLQNELNQQYPRYRIPKKAA